MTPPARSAGLLLHRATGGGVQVLIAHMGGPFWAKRNTGAWSIPKGEYGPDEDALTAAHREFAEELGSPAPPGRRRALGDIRQRNGKVVTAWAIEADFDVALVHSNTFDMEWPPHSGRRETFPEVDRAAWVDPDTAAALLVTAQAAFVERLLTALRPDG